jgi:lipoprotein-anchoring transpeptidase ErfK/SrfK
MSERVISRGSSVTVAALAVAGLIAAGGAGARGPTHGVAGERVDVRTCADGARRPVGTANIAWAAYALRPTAAYRSPAGAVVARFGIRNVNRAPMVFGVVGEQVDRRCRATWLRVALPMRPNGVTGWVRARDVRRSVVRARVVVDLSQRRLRLFRHGRLVLSSPVAIGSSATPTPIGRYYVNQRLVPADPGGPFGPGAVGISAFSNVLTGWTQGGPIAIHGTNEPWSIGHSVSNGCIRLPNPVLRRVFRLAIDGTPVVIHP